MKCGARARQGLLLAAQQAAENLPDRIALTAAAAEDTAQEAAEWVVPAASSAGATQDAAQDVAEAATAGRGLRLGVRRGGFALCQLFADVCQHDGREDRQQFLDQITTTGARSRQR